ncbi:Ras family protein [Histomonas meleagridis]|uniref:Ras family protein n=1 Tax=Histomonas meleagridis TaxID=135588 RepID=UPI00355A2541|nr:Ras family protein [Histomonas meleagridis]KAH0804240.1 Ras family protein [Histomonas meleagridis]
MDNTEEEIQPTQKVLKIIVVGDMGTGKTSLIRKFVEGNFSEFYKITIGVDFANKVLKFDENSTADVQLWDIAGQERFGSMTGVYYREAVGAVVVFDVMRNATFDMTKVWKKDIDEKVRTSLGVPVPTILLGNKIDLMEKNEAWEKKKQEIEEYTKENNFLAFFETSAKDGINIDESLEYLVEYILKNNIESESSRMNDGVRLGQNQQEEKGCGC